MKCAVVLADGIKQIMFTPESENEKMALKMINIDDDIDIERHFGSFYDDEKTIKGYNVALCKGGYLRAYKDSDSLMLVLKKKEEKE